MYFALRPRDPHLHRLRARRGRDPRRSAQRVRVLQPARARAPRGRAPRAPAPARLNGERGDVRPLSQRATRQELARRRLARRRSSGRLPRVTPRSRARGRPDPPTRRRSPRPAVPRLPSCAIGQATTRARLAAARARRRARRTASRAPSARARATPPTRAAETRDGQSSAAHRNSGATRPRASHSERVRSPERGDRVAPGDHPGEHAQAVAAPRGSDRTRSSPGTGGCAWRGSRPRAPRSRAGRAARAQLERELRARGARELAARVEQRARSPARRSRDLQRRRRAASARAG